MGARFPSKFRNRIRKAVWVLSSGESTAHTSLSAERLERTKAIPGEVMSVVLLLSTVLNMNEF